MFGIITEAGAELNDLFELVTSDTVEFNSDIVPFEVDVDNRFVVEEDSLVKFDWDWEGMCDEDNCGGKDVGVDNKYLINNFI